MAIFLPGYSGTVWNAARSAISYANSNLKTNNLPQAKLISKAVAATLKNAGTALAVSMIYQGIQQLFANLVQLIPLSLNLDAATQAFLMARVNALQAAGLALNELFVTPLQVNAALAGGKAAVPDPQYLEWLVAFSFEVPPAGLGASDPWSAEFSSEFGPPADTLATSVSLANQAQAAATAWTTIATALRQQGVSYSGAVYNTVVLMGNASQVAANSAANALVTGSTSTTQLWNQFVAMPAITRAASAVVNDPTDQVAQNTAVIRYVMLNTLQQFNQLIVSLRQTVTSQLRLGTVRQGDSLMTLASRELNDYTAWRQIAQLNGLQPPYIAKVSGNGVAAPGQQLFLPSPNTSSLITPQTGPVASYITNYLGVDKFLGPLNDAMLQWTGDYQIISGYDNLSLSLGRRLQTTISSLIYHTVFGSRIPPEVGKIASVNELRLIEQYSRSALLSDPRVNKIVSCTAVSGPNYSIVIQAVVLPNGLGQEEVTVNEVIGPA